jgi:hypothetical protein
MSTAKATGRACRFDPSQEPFCGRNPSRNWGKRLFQCLAEGLEESFYHVMTVLAVPAFSMQIHETTVRQCQKELAGEGHIKISRSGLGK